MPIYQLEREHLQTLSSSAENKPLQPLESTTYNRYRLVEFTGNLQISEALQKSGWDSFAESKRFISDINLGLIKGLTLEQSVAFSTQIFADHIRFYDAEFIKQESVLPHRNYFGFWQGERRLLGNNGRPVVHGVDETERLGASKRAAQKTERLLLEADNNSLVVSMSAKGVSGYKDEYGQDNPHLNTYILIDWKDQAGDLKGLTLVTDLTIDQAERVMEGLGAPANFMARKDNELQRLANLLENPALLSLPAAYHDPVGFVFDKILAERGEGDIHLRQKSGPDEVRSVAEVRQKIASFEALLDLDVTKDRLIKGFKEFVTANYQNVESPSFQQKIINMAEETVLLFTRYYRKHHQKDLSAALLANAPQHTNYAYEDDRKIVRLPEGVDRIEFFREEIAFLQSRAGCPSSRNSSGKGSTVAGVSVFGESDSMGSLYFPCPVCGAINKRPWEGFVSNCQSCGSDKVACKSSDTKKEKKQEYNIELKKAA